MGPSRLGPPVALLPCMLKRQGIWHPNSSGSVTLAPQEAAKLWKICHGGFQPHWGMAPP
eukprot:CAMPEP_0170630288 /NCGR_PEP_ID=MMETSP0224-20130122/33891_1 /TAXON_ID=285029 /ORGANISM="Togula jolla, Strain CCCM 725" /LENGTH=58 /DNA_ID=CAMNT_0010958277 /DNA_START=246 /DNA_END=419 /DNA_ORIENTATION=+